MDVIAMNNMGVFVIGGLWGLYIIGSRLMQDRADRHRQTKHDDAQSTLLTALNAAVTRGEDSVMEERKKNQELHATLVQQARELGAANGSIEFERRLREQSEKDREATQTTLESLAIEVTNLRKSNAELVKFNKELLQHVNSLNHKDSL